MRNVYVILLGSLTTFLGILLYLSGSVCVILTIHTHNIQNNGIVQNSFLKISVYFTCRNYGTQTATGIPALYPRGTYVYKEHIRHALKRFLLNCFYTNNKN